MIPIKVKIYILPTPFLLIDINLILIQKGNSASGDFQCVNQKLIDLNEQEFL